MFRPEEEVDEHEGSLAATQTIEVQDLEYRARCKIKSSGSNLATYSYSTGISVKQILGQTETAEFLSVTSVEVSLFSSTSKQQGSPKFLTESKTKLDCDFVRVVYGEALSRLVEYANLCSCIASCYDLATYRKFLLEVQKLESDLATTCQPSRNPELIIMAVENVMARESSHQLSAADTDLLFDDESVAGADAPSQDKSSACPQRHLPDFFDHTSITVVTLTRSKLELQNHRSPKSAMSVEVSTVSVHINDDVTAVRVNNLRFLDPQENRGVGKVEHVSLDQFSSHLKGACRFGLTRSEVRSQRGEA